MTDLKYETLKAAEFMRSGDQITVLKTVTNGHCGLHDHDFIEFAYIESGKGYHIVGGQRDNIKKGDFFIFNAKVPHEYAAEGDRPIVIYNCIFKPEFIDSSFEECRDFVDIAYHYLFHSFYSEDDPKDFIKLTGAKSGKIEAILENMYDEYETGANGYMQILKSELIKLLILAFRLYTEDAAQVQSSPVLKKLVVDSSAEYMRSHYASPITCEFLAERSYLSVSYFNKVFKTETGKTALKFLQDIRMKKAAELLRTTDMSTSDVGYSVGYSDTKHFYRLFRTATGQTPGEYRRAQSGEAK